MTLNVENNLLELERLIHSLAKRDVSDNPLSIDKREKRNKPNRRGRKQQKRRKKNRRRQNRVRRKKKKSGKIKQSRKKRKNNAKVISRRKKNKNKEIETED